MDKCFVIYLALMVAISLPTINGQKCCGPNEVWSSCAFPCQTCEFYGSIEPMACTMMCRSGCACKDGYARNSGGKCVQITTCRCEDPNAHMVTCPNPCPLTCDNYQSPPVVCTRMCVQYGCTCKKGYVLNTNTGRCVLPKQCPKLP